MFAFSSSRISRSNWLLPDELPAVCPGEGNELVRPLPMDVAELVELVEDDCRLLLHSLDNRPVMRLEVRGEICRAGGFGTLGSLKWRFSP